MPAWVAVEKQTPGLLAAPLWRKEVGGKSGVGEQEAPAAACDVVEDVFVLSGKQLAMGANNKHYIKGFISDRSAQLMLPTRCRFLHARGAARGL